MTSVTEILDREGVEYEVLPHPRVFTGIAEAHALGIRADAVLKTVIVDTKGEHVAIVLPSDEHLDMGLVRDALSDPDADLADEVELAGDFGSFELGALPPIAPLLGVDTFVDPTVRDHGPVIFAGGSQTESIKVEADELFAFQPVQFAQVADVWNTGRS
jgi:Ala-tRNA(Pro) deacylase